MKQYLANKAAGLNIQTIKFPLASNVVKKIAQK